MESCQIICWRQVWIHADFQIPGFRDIETRPHFQLTIMANRYPNDPFNQYSPLYQPRTSMNFPGSGSMEFLQIPWVLLFKSRHAAKSHSTNAIAIAIAPDWAIKPRTFDAEEPRAMANKRRGERRKVSEMLWKSFQAWMTPWVGPSRGCKPPRPSKIS